MDKEDVKAKKIREFFTTTKKYDIEKKIRKQKISVSIQCGLNLFQALH
jgi:hypothetical protein